MTPIKILFIIPSLKGGGAERVISYIINNIEYKTFCPVLVVIDSSHNGYTINPAVKQYKLGISSIKFSFFSLRKIIKAENPDIVMSTLTYLNTYLGLIKPFLSFGSTKFIARESTIPSLNNRRHSLYFIYDLLTRLSYKQYIKIICQSNDMLLDLVNYFKVPTAKLTIINNPIDNSILENNKLHSFKTRPSMPIRFITISMLRPEKGIIRILQALSLLDFDFKYFIVGEGIERDSIENMVQSLGLKSKVRLLGFQQDPSKIMAKCDLFLQGSYYEGFPNVLLEATLLGLPLVAYNCPGGTSEVINESINGCLVPNDNKEDYADAIKLVLSKKLDKNNISNYSQDKFSMNKIIPIYEKLFIDTVNN